MRRDEKKPRMYWHWPLDNGGSFEIVCASNLTADDLREIGALVPLVMNTLRKVTTENEAPRPPREGGQP